MLFIALKASAHQKTPRLPLPSLLSLSPPVPRPALSAIHERDQLVCLSIGAQLSPDLVLVLVLWEPTHGEEQGTVRRGLWLLHAARQRGLGLPQ